MSTLSQEWLEKKTHRSPIQQASQYSRISGQMSPRRAKGNRQTPRPLASAASHSWFLFSLNNSGQGLSPTSVTWCLFSTRAMPHPLPTNNLQSFHKAPFLSCRTTIVCLLPESHYFFWFDLPCLFSYVYMQIILPELEHLVLHRLDSTISKTLETQVRETSYPTSTFKRQCYKLQFFLTSETTNPCTCILLYFNLSMGDNNGLDTTQTLWSRC